MQEDWKQFVPDVTFELIPIKNLVSNQNYQRNISLTHVDRTAEHFDLHQINLVKVSRRNGINYVFNGQHTIETVVRVSGSRDTPVWCMIYNDLDYETEADIFANQMRFTKSLSPYEIFAANIEAGNPLQLTIKALVESYSLTITSNNKAPGAVNAVSAMESIYTKYGYHVLDETLFLCISAWEGDPVSFTGSMLKGIAKLITTFGDNLQPELFVERLGRVSAKEITRNARDRHNGSLGFAEALLTYYNRKTKHPLHWSKLYNTKTENEESDESSDIDDQENASTDDQYDNVDLLSSMKRETPIISG